MNQYQANHDQGSRVTGSNNLYAFFRVIILLSVLLLAMWFWS